MTLLSPAPALLITALLSWALFAFSGFLRARPVREESKEEIYLCGESEEALPTKEKEPSLNPEYRRFFATAFLFTIMEIGALFLGTIPQGQGRALPLAFLGLMLASVSAILVEVFDSR